MILLKINEWGDNMSMKSNILLESGTGELEVLKFRVKDVLYAINVIKVKEILQIEDKEINPLPSQPESVRGMTNIRGEVVTVIDLHYYLDCGITRDNDQKSDYMILTEFNNMKVLFVVDEVIGIDRLSWKGIQKPSGLMGKLVNGIIELDDELVSFLDFEKILSDVKPEMVMQLDDSRIDKVNKVRRKNITLVLADDSPTIRGILKKTLNLAGYSDLIIFDDGEKLLDYLLKLKKEKDGDILEYVQGVITDIEMPQMDGHTLIKKINEDRYLRSLPTLIFSSLITEDLRHKGEAVGADEQISKPEIENLIDVLDELVLNND